MTDRDPSQDEQILVDFITSELIDKHEAVEIGAESDLLASGLIDSLAVMRLVKFIENGRGVSIHPADVTIENFTNVRRIVHYLSSLDSSLENGDGREPEA